MITRIFPYLFNSDRPHDRGSTRRGITTADSQEEDAIPCPFSSCEHLLAIFEEVMVELYEAKELFGEEFTNAEPSFKLHKLCADRYFAKVWSLSQVFLRLEALRGMSMPRDLFNVSVKSPSWYQPNMPMFISFTSLFVFFADGGNELPLHERPLDPFLQLLYGDMKKFVIELKDYVDLPTVDVSNFFEPFINRWLARKEVEYLENIVPTLLDLEKKHNWQAMEQDSCQPPYSHSVTNLLTFLHGTYTQFKIWPHSLSHCRKLIQVQR
jgi:hypothetical protein